MMFAKYFIILPLFFIVTFGLNAENLEGDNPQTNQGYISIEIHHCTTCGFRAKASMLADKINKELGLTAQLISGEIGSFDVYMNGNLLFSKAKVGRFPNPDEIVQMIDKYTNTSKISSPLTE